MVSDPDEYEHKWERLTPEEFHAFNALDDLIEAEEKDGRRTAAFHAASNALANRAKVLDPPEQVERVTYSVVEAYRDDEGRPRQRTIATLGYCPTIEAKVAQIRERQERRRTSLEKYPPRHPDLLVMEAAAIAAMDDEVAELEALAEQMTAKETA